MVCPWNVVVVICLRWVLHLEAEGGAYNTVGQRAGTRNTVQALPHPEGSKRSPGHILTILPCRGAGHGV